MAKKKARGQQDNSPLIEVTEQRYSLEEDRQNRLTFVYTQFTLIFKVTHMPSCYYISLRQRNGEKN